MKAFDSGNRDSARNAGMQSFALNDAREMFSLQKASLK
jgi:hypothetical protein